MINSDVGLTIGTDNNIRLRVDNSNVKIESTVNEQDLEISVKSIVEQLQLSKLIQAHKE